MNFESVGFDLHHVETVRTEWMALSGAKCSNHSMLFIVLCVCAYFYYRRNVSLF